MVTPPPVVEASRPLLEDRLVPGRLEGDSPGLRPGLSVLGLFVRKKLWAPDCQPSIPAPSGR